MEQTFTYERQGRSATTLIILSVIWFVLLAAWVWLDAAPVILAIVAAFTLPALWDFVTNPSAGLTITNTTLEWHSGRRTAHVNLSEIAQVRLDTRLDLSVRATVITKSGQKIRIPYEATPPHKTFEKMLSARGIATERHHFSLRQ